MARTAWNIFLFPACILIGVSPLILEIQLSHLPIGLFSLALPNVQREALFNYSFDYCSFYSICSIFIQGVFSLIMAIPLFFYSKLWKVFFFFETHPLNHDLCFSAVFNLLFPTFIAFINAAVTLFSWKQSFLVSEDTFIRYATSLWILLGTQTGGFLKTSADPGRRFISEGHICVVPSLWMAVFSHGPRSPSGRSSSQWTFLHPRGLRGF